MRHTLLLGAAIALVACSDALAPVTVGEPYLLRSINGHPIPWTTPPADSQYIPTTITEGWVTMLNDSSAERHERFGRWVVDANGDSIPLFAEWTHSAAYRRRSGTVVLTYHFWTPGAFGPSRAAETLYVTPRGGLMLRETGFVPPLDSIIRVFCTSAQSC